MSEKNSLRYWNDVTAARGYRFDILYHLDFQRFVSAFNTESELERKYRAQDIAVFKIGSASVLRSS